MERCMQFIQVFNWKSLRILNLKIVVYKRNIIKHIIKVYYMFFVSMNKVGNVKSDIKCHKISDIKQIPTTDKFFHYKWGEIQKQKMPDIKHTLTTVINTLYQIHPTGFCPSSDLWMLGYFNLRFRITSP